MGFGLDEVLRHWPAQVSLGALGAVARAPKSYPCAPELLDLRQCRHSQGLLNPPKLRAASSNATPYIIASVCVHRMVFAAAVGNRVVASAPALGPLLAASLGSTPSRF